MDVQLLVLNFNGRSLLERCLPSVVAAAWASRLDCRVAVVDNASTDDSLAFLRNHFPHVAVHRRPNRGLSSFNDVLAECPAPTAVLLNNDVRLDRGAVDPLVAPLLAPSTRDACFLTAARLRNFADQSYEGQKTAVFWNKGLVQATSMFPGHEAGILTPGLTASAGAAIAVDVKKFLELGGFDPIYLPGRLEDLDFAYRGHAAGYLAHYTPDAVGDHLGAATFREVFGDAGCDALALRNTLLFQWLNLHAPSHRLRQAFWLPLRLAHDLAAALWTPAPRRARFVQAFSAAVGRWWTCRERLTRRPNVKAERLFFERFHPQAILDAPAAGKGIETAKKGEPGFAMSLEAEGRRLRVDGQHVVDFECQRRPQNSGEAAE